MSCVPDDPFRGWKHVPDWAGLQARLGGQCPAWVPLWKVGKITKTMKAIKADTDLQIVDEPRVEINFVNDMLIDLTKPFTEKDRVAHRNYIVQKYPFVNVKRRDSEKKCRRAPGRVHLYPPDQGFSTSFLKCVVEYMDFCRSGVDSRVKKGGAAAPAAWHPSDHAEPQRTALAPPPQRAPSTQLAAAKRRAPHCLDDDSDSKSAASAPAKRPALAKRPPLRSSKSSFSDDSDSHYSDSDCGAALPVAVARPLPAAVGVPVARNAQVKLGADPGRFAPPPFSHQYFRYAAVCTDLEKFLKKKCVFNFAGPAHWATIQMWTKSTKGRTWLREQCGLDPDGVHLDHIRPKEGGNIAHLFNCYFMISGANSHFKDLWNHEKKRYVGENASTVSGEFCRWFVNEATAHVDVSKFKRFAFS